MVEAEQIPRPVEGDYSRGNGREGVTLVLINISYLHTGARGKREKEKEKEYHNGA